MSDSNIKTHLQDFEEHLRRERWTSGCALLISAVVILPVLMAFLLIMIHGLLSSFGLYIIIEHIVSGILVLTGLGLVWIAWYHFNLIQKDLTMKSIIPIWGRVIIKEEGEYKDEMGFIEIVYYCQLEVLDSMSNILRDSENLKEVKNSLEIIIPIDELTYKSLYKHQLLFFLIATNSRRYYCYDKVFKMVVFGRYYIVREDKRFLKSY